ncbi:Gfo/Idh/MocA family oxidoreductase [Pseudomonas asplenii]|uniref:Gfo/Idh/MocA family oxidoreductase n=1 Tax=Pseudomonas asplenii TaxID=53407 RepID=UPI0022342ABB|nr:Gfo/Idh/MocA family oxidoreductase [Pseudomonas asplenii]UZE29990.1 Gfo/Idh/MocA family oxidoreductase [Pseudomonas asplenii]
MNILIVGLGYAGKRFQSAFEQLSQNYNIQLSYCSRRPKKSPLPYYANLKNALRELRPEIVVVSANDINHAEVLIDLAGYSGFVICEKPMLTSSDDLLNISEGLRNISGFALDLVERYSDATARLKLLAEANNWKLIRSSFHWGKDRLNDYRPTCGVVSEVIHALDLVSWICPSTTPLKLQHSLGVKSDFSISGSDVLDTVMFTADLGKAAVVGYASFVNIHRQRTVDFTFSDPAGQIIHSRLEFDEPSWDSDHLRIWTRNERGAIVDLEQHSYQGASGTSTSTILKLSRLCLDVMRFVADGIPPLQTFAGLETAMQLQTLLNEIDTQSLTSTSVQYVQSGMRTLIPEDADLESLG